jgi:hypothetical protein
MTITATTGLAAQSTPTTDTATAADSSNKTDSTKSASAIVADSKQQLNLSIIQASLVSISSQNDPLSLVYKSAIENINEALKPTLGDNALQNATSQDNSPEATAGRIVSLTTGLFDLYKKSFPNEDESTVLDRFTKVIQSGVDEGFKEARGMLDSMSVLNGSIADNINKTYDLVTKGLADFVTARKAQIATASSLTDAATTTANTASTTDTATGNSVAGS